MRAILLALLLLDKREHVNLTNILTFLIATLVIRATLRELTEHHLTNHARSMDVW